MWRVTQYFVQNLFWKYHYAAIDSVASVGRI